MSYTPIGMPEPVNRFLSEGAPKLGLLDLTEQTMRNALNQTVEGSLISPVVEFYNKHFGQANMLSPEEAKEKYPNVDYPKGGDEWVIRKSSQDKEFNDYTNMLLASSDHPWFASNMGALLANALTPSGVLIGALSSGAGSAIEASLAPRVASILAKGAIRVGAGAVSGLTAAVPLTAAQAYSQQQIQEPMTWEEAGKNILSMVGLGAALHTVFGAKVPIAVEDQKLALKTAQAQVDAGKVVSVDPLIQNSLAHHVENPAELEEARAKYANVISQVETKRPLPQEMIKELNLTTLAQEISTLKEALPKETEQLPALQNFVDQVKGKMESEQMGGMGQQLEQVETKPGVTPIQDVGTLFQSIDEKIQSLEGKIEKSKESEFIQTSKDKISRLKKLREKFTPEKGVSAFTQKEKEFLETEFPKLKKILKQEQLPHSSKEFQEQIKSYNEKESGALQQIETKRPSPQLYEGLSKAENATIDLKQIREEIQTYGQKYGRKKIKNLSRLSDQLSEQEYLNDLTKKVQQDSEIYQELVATKPEPPTPEEMISARQKMMSWESNHAIFPNEYRNSEFVKEAYLTPEEETTLYENHLKSLDESGELTKEDKANLEDLQEEQKNETSIATSLKNFINCLISGGAE